MSAEHHGREFFEEMAACHAAYRRLADAIDHVLRGPRRVIDVGAGLGHVAGRLKELGWDATASDPYSAGYGRDCRVPRPFDACLDFPWEVWPGGIFEVVICTETAEHIDASAADTVVANVAGLAQETIVWSAAQPGQEWPGHVNLQAPSYWLERFSRRGWEPVNELTARLRIEMRARHAQHEYCADNFFVLARRQ